MDDTPPRSGEVFRCWIPNQLEVMMLEILMEVFPLRVHDSGWDDSRTRMELMPAWLMDTELRREKILPERRPFTRGMVRVDLSRVASRRLSATMVTRRWAAGGDDIF